MKQLVLVLLFSFSVSSCYNRFSCGPAQNKNLGAISFSSSFQDWNKENQHDTLFFSNSTDTLRLLTSTTTSSKPKRAKAYHVCESIDIKPYTAYAFYEYPNKERMFQGDATLLHIDPVIVYEDQQKQELLYLNLAYGNNSIKAAIPANTSDQKGPPFTTQGTRFIWQKTVSLGDKKFSYMWVCEANGLAMYYHPRKGMVAIRIDNTIFYKH